MFLVQLRYAIHLSLQATRHAYVLTHRLLQIRENHEQTLHLVLRDRPPISSQANRSAPAMSHSPRSASETPRRQEDARYQLDTRNPNTGLPPHSTHQPADQSNSNQQPYQQTHQQAHHQHQTMVQWINQLHREANYRQMINANQRDRAAMGFHGIHDGHRNTAGTQPDTVDRAGPTPSQTHTVVRDTISPDGQHFRVTVNETVVGPLSTLNPHLPGTSVGGRSEALGATPQPAPARGGLSAAEIRTMLRGPEVAQATQAMTDAMQRSISAVSLSSMSSAAPQVGVTVPMHLRQSLSRGASRTATPEPSLGTSAARPRSQGPRNSSDVYIVSSPAGVQALLINNNQLYSTPSIRMPTYPLPLVPTPQSLPPPPPAPPAPPLSRFPLGSEDILAQWQQDRQQAPTLQPAEIQGQQRGPAQQDPPGGPPRVDHAVQAPPPNNPGAGAMAALWPHIWLLVRLVLFVWWFTTPNSSWSRWATVISMAVAVFIINTGLLDGAANQAWGPFRRHLEGLLPLADFNPARGQEAALVPMAAAHDNNAGAVEPPNRPAARAGPDPGQAAARLIEQRREANASWLLDQVRRVERAGLLFLASIAPGVAERHIARLETEARAERQRREAADAAAAAAAAAAANAAQTGRSRGAEGQD